jgi:hypothetical protein
MPTSITKPGPAPVQCPNCGEWLNEDDLYCRYCGKPMVSTGFDDEGNTVVRTVAGQGGNLRAVGERPTLSDPLNRRPKREGALARVNTGALGCTTIALVLAGILLVVMVVAWFLIRPGMGDSARDGVRDGLARELSLHGVGVDTTTATVDEVTINEYLDASESWFDPVSDLSVDLTDNQAEVSFSLYGLSGTFSAGLTVQDGLIRLVSPEAGGAGGRLIDTAEMAQAIETELRIFLQNQGRPVTNVAIDDGVLTLTFAEAT